MVELALCSQKEGEAEMNRRRRSVLPPDLALEQRRMAEDEVIQSAGLTRQEEQVLRMRRGRVAAGAKDLPLEFLDQDHPGTRVSLARREKKALDRLKGGQK